MINVMIVDDEMLVRIGLRSTISWEEFGFAVTADAANGAQAIEKFEMANPDILITDIRMPGMDGIELIKVLKEKKPQLKTVILTNYDNFEYAKKALDLGADEYLLKTSLDNQTILPKLQKLQNKITRETEQNLEYSQLQKKALMGLSYLKKHFTERLLSGKLDPGEWEGILKELNLRWEGHLFQLVLLKSGAPSRETSQINSQTLHLIEEIAEKINGSTVWESSNAKEWVVIYNYASAEALKYSKQGIPFNIRQIKSCLKQYFQLTTFAVFGKSDLTYSELPDQWQELRKAANYRFFWPEKELIFWEDLPEKNPVNFPLGLLENNLGQFVRRGEGENVKNVLDEIFENVRQTLSPSLLHQVWHELLSELFRLSREHGIRLPIILDDQEQDEDYLERFQTIFEIKAWFYQKFELIIQQIRNHSSRTYSFPIRQAIAFIDENYNRDIKLVALAHQVRLSKNHLCTLFRSETGLNFVDYLHRLRIDQAKELLETTDLRVSEVGLKVGYQDAKYFTKVFQKYQNCTPSEYREKSN